MAIDLRRGVQTALAATVKQSKPQKAKNGHMSTGKAVLLGAGIVTAGRMAAGTRVGTALQNRLVDALEPGSRQDEAQHEDLDYEGEDFDDEQYDEDEEPQAEEDEDFVDEQYDEDEEPPEAEEDEAPAPPRRARRRGRARA